jgi:O-antigen/teichoic acid export membrane protein
VAISFAVEAGVQSANVSHSSIDEVGETGHLLDDRQAGTRFLRGSSLRLVAFAAGIAVGLGATPFAVHHLGPVAWGQYATVIAVMFIVAAITEGGLGQLGVRELSVGGGNERRQFMRDLLGLRITLTCTGAVLAFCFSIGVGYAPVVVEGTVIAAIGLLLTNVAGTLSLPLTAELRFGWLAVVDFVPQLVSAVTTVVLVVVGATLLPFYGVSALAGGSALLVTACLARGRVSLLPAFRLKRWKPLIAQTFVYAAVTASGAMYFRIVLLATSLLSTRAQTGYFSLAFRVLELATVVPWLIVSSAFPILVRSASHDRDRLRYAVERLLQGGLILGGWFALCVVIGAPFAVHVLALGSPRFDASTPVLRILGAAIPATFLLATLSYTLLSLQRHRQLLIANASIVLLAVALSVTLIPTLGATGAALVSVTLEIVLMCSYMWTLVRAHPELRPSMSGTGRIALSLGLAFVVGGLLAPHPIIGVLVGSLTLAAALVSFRAVPAELYALIGR